MQGNRYKPGKNYFLPRMPSLQVKDGNIYKINRGSIIPAEYTCLIPLFSFSAKTRFSQVRSNQLSLRIQKKGVPKLAN
jgi:hypothetical protein